jgi:hypothetical protein
LAAVAALVAILAFVPAVQRWAVLRAVSGRPGLQLEIERLAVRPGSVAVRNLRLAWPGGKMALVDGAADLSLWELVAHRRVVIGNANATGLSIDLSPRPAVGVGAPVVAHPPAAGLAESAPAPFGLPVLPAFPAFGGIFKHLHLPLEVVLGQCNVEAEIVYPQAADRPPGRAHLKLTGGHFAPGQEAKFDFDLTVRNSDPTAPVDAVETRGTLTATLGPASTFERLGAHLEAEARGPRLATPARLQAYVALARTAAGESYSILLNSLDGAAADHLLSLNVDYVAGSSQLTGTWQVRASDRQIAPFALGVTLPEFSAVGEGRFEFNPTNLTARLAGRLSGGVSRLEVLDGRLRDFNGLSTTTSFDVDYDGSRVRITELLAKISGRTPLLTLQSIQPFSFEFGSRRLLAADPEKELLQVDIEGVPVGWLRPWLPSRLAVAGGEVTGALGAALRDERVWLHTRTPLSVHGLTVAEAGRVLLPASDISLEAELEYAKNETRVNLAGLTLQTAAGDRLEARGGLQTRSGGGPAVVAQADFEGQLPTLLAAYLPLGPVQARGTLALTQSGRTVQVDRFSVSLRSPAGLIVAEATASEAFRFDTANGQVATVSGRPGEVLRVKLGRIPLSVLQPYCGAFTVTGEFGGAELSLDTRGGRLHLGSVAPWRIEKLSVGRAGRAWLQDLTVELEPGAEYSNEGVTATVGDLRVRNPAGANVLSARAEVSLGPDFRPPKLQGTASFDLTVPALAGQPFLAGLALSSQGKLSGEAKFSYDRDLLGEGRLTLNGLTSPATGEPLPVANLSFRAGLSEKGDVALQVPLLIDRAGERSDLTLAAALHPAPHGRTLDARISSAYLVVDDVLALVGSFAGLPAAGPAAAPPADAAPDAKAAWDGLTGQVTVDLKSLAYGRTAEIKDLTGRLAIEPARVTADKIAGKVGPDGQLLLKAEVAFAAGQPQPYTSKLDFNLQGFEVGPLFKAIAPDRPPTIEGRFDVRSQAEGAGRTLGDLVEHTRGDFTLQSRKGVFRGLRQAAQAARTAGIISSAARLLSNLGEKVENLAAGADVAAQVGGMLAALPFDQLSLRLSRDQSLNVKLSNFSLVSPNVRLQGDGLVTYDAGKSLLNQSMQMRMNMGVMGPVETALTRAKSSLLAGERDELGYMKLKEPFVVGGTPGKPDPGQLYLTLGRSLLDILRR